MPSPYPSDVHQWIVTPTFGNLLDSTRRLIHFNRQYAKGKELNGQLSLSLIHILNLTILFRCYVLDDGKSICIHLPLINALNGVVCHDIKLKCLLSLFA